MERKKYLLIVLVLIVGFKSLMSQDYNKKKIYQAYISGDMGKWKTIMDKMEENKINTTGYYYQLIEYQYGYIAYCLGNEKDELAEDYLDLALDNLDKYRDLGGNENIADSFESSFSAFEIGINSYKAPFLGKKSKEFGEKSIEDNSRQPLVLINYGNMLYNMPAFYGGDKKEGLKYLIMAKFYMEKEKKYVTNNWLYLNLLTLIGQAYEELGEIEKARKIYKYALIREPEFDYVKNNLLPNLNK